MARERIFLVVVAAGAWACFEGDPEGKESGGSTTELSGATTGTSAAVMTSLDDVGISTSSAGSSGDVSSSGTAVADSSTSESDGSSGDESMGVPGGSETESESTGSDDCALSFDGTPCGNLQICLTGVCVASECGDGFVDEARGEKCEDGNVIDGDGCESNCQWTCDSDDDCDDNDICTGIEVCTVDHTCSNPPDLRCDDGNPCTADSCDPILGCLSTLIDGDGDGYAPESLGACGAGTRGGDCDDTDPGIHPNAFDGCDGMSRDNDCDGEIDEDGTGRWYADCDGDGFAALGAQMLESCEQPAVAPEACSGGSWTTAEPFSPIFDCDDATGSVRPGMEEIPGNGRDDNCDTYERCYRDQDGDGYRTDETVLTTNVSCSSDGLALASAALEWPDDYPPQPCCDRDPNMHRGQTSYFSFSQDPIGNEHCPAGLRWDYNCNGTESRRYTDTVWSCFWEPAGCSRGGSPATSGWFSSTSSVPGCGSPPLLWASRRRQNGLTSCSWESLEIREQGCR